MVVYNFVTKLSLIYILLLFQSFIITHSTNERQRVMTPCSLFFNQVTSGKKKRAT